MITLSSILSSVGWKFAERVGLQIGKFLLTLILARLLSPQDYGVVALVLVFTSIMSTLIQAGFNIALIQKKDATADDFTSVCIFSLFAAFFLYTLLYLSAPFIANFYHIPSLTQYMRVLGIMLFPGAFNSVQVAFVTKHLQFKMLTLANFIALAISFIAGIILAYLHFGAWALIAQQLLMQMGICIVLMLRMTWSPFRGHFNLERLRTLFSFGVNILCSNLLITVFLNLRTILVGKFYTPSELGVFNRGNHFPQAIMESVQSTIQSVLLPIYTTEQDDVELLVLMLRKTIRIAHFILCPLLMGLLCVAEPLVLITLTDKWVSCIPFVQILAFSYLLHPFQLITAQAMNAKGRPDILLRIEIIRKTGEIGLLLLALPVSVKMVAWSAVGAGIIGILATLYPNFKILKYSLANQMWDIFPTFGLCILMSICVYFVSYVPISVYLLLPLQILIGGSIYIGLAYLFKMQAFLDLLKIGKFIYGKYRNKGLAL